MHNNLEELLVDWAKRAGDSGHDTDLQAEVASVVDALRQAIKYAQHGQLPDEKEIDRWRRTLGLRCPVSFEEPLPGPPLNIQIPPGTSGRPTNETPGHPPTAEPALWTV